MRPKVDLRQAMAQVVQQVATEMTFRELVAAYYAVQFGSADRLRKWVECFGDESAWPITTRQSLWPPRHSSSPASTNPPPSIATPPPSAPSIVGLCGGTWRRLVLCHPPS